MQNQPAMIKGRIASPAVGTDAPDFSLVNPLNGQDVQLRDYIGQDVLLVFFRGTWCPFCREQIKVLSDNYSRLQGANIQLLGVLCQNEASVHDYLKQNPLPFPLLPDVRRTVARAYGVHYWLSLEGVNLANPSLFIIDKKGTISFRYVGRNMSDLPVNTILEKFLTFLKP